MRQSSLDAYKQAKKARGQRHREICEALARHGDLTDLEISHHTGLPINCVTPRRGELYKEGIIKERGYKFQGRIKVHVWGL